MDGRLPYSFLVGKPYHRCSGPGVGGRDQEAVSPECGRNSAAEAGDAVMVIFHPLVKVIIFPTSFSVLPLPQLTTGLLSNWVARAGDPGRTHWSQK